MPAEDEAGADTGDGFEGEATTDEAGDVCTEDTCPNDAPLSADGVIVTTFS